MTTPPSSRRPFWMDASAPAASAPQTTQATPAPSSPTRSGQDVLTVSEVNRRIAGLLERNFPLGWVRGEISNFTRAASGHWYFSLKDAGAQLSCVLFRGDAARPAARAVSICPGAMQLARILRSPNRFFSTAGWSVSPARSPISVSAATSPISPSTRPARGRASANG